MGETDQNPIDSQEEDDLRYYEAYLQEVNAYNQSAEDGNKLTTVTHDEIKAFAKKNNIPISEAVTQQIGIAMESIQKQVLGEDKQEPESPVNKQEELTTFQRMASKDALGGEMLPSTYYEKNTLNSELNKQEKLFEELTTFKKQQENELLQIETLLSRLLDGVSERKVSKDSNTNLDNIKKQYDEYLKKLTQERQTVLDKYNQTKEHLEKIEGNLKGIQDAVSTESDSNELPSQVTNFRADTIDLKPLEPFNTIPQDTYSKLGEMVTKFGGGTGSIRSGETLERDLAKAETPSKEEKTSITLEPQKQEIAPPSPVIPPPQSTTETSSNDNEESTPVPQPSRVPAPSKLEPQQTSSPDTTSNSEFSEGIGQPHDSSNKIEDVIKGMRERLQTEFPETDNKSDSNNGMEFIPKTESPKLDIEEPISLELPSELPGKDVFDSSLEGDSEINLEILDNTKLTNALLEQLISSVIPALATNNITNNLGGPQAGNQGMPMQIPVPNNNFSKNTKDPGIPDIPGERVRSLEFTV